MSKSTEGFVFDGAVTKRLEALLPDEAPMHVLHEALLEYEKVTA